MNFLPVETQNFASLLLQEEGLGIGMTMAAACRDAKSCVSRATNTLTNHILLRTFHRDSPTRETQKVASLLWFDSGFWN